MFGEYIICIKISPSDDNAAYRIGDNHIFISRTLNCHLIYYAMNDVFNELKHIVFEEHISLYVQPLINAFNWLLLPLTVTSLANYNSNTS